MDNPNRKTDDQKPEAMDVDESPKSNDGKTPDKDTRCGSQATQPQSKRVKRHSGEGGTGSKQDGAEPKKPNLRADTPRPSNRQNVHNPPSTVGTSGGSSRSANVVSAEEMRLKRLSRLTMASSTSNNSSSNSNNTSNNSSSNTSAASSNIPQSQGSSSTGPEEIMEEKKKMMQQREAWLNRMASIQPKKEAGNNTSQSSPVSSENKKKVTSSMSPITKNFAAKLTISPKPDSAQDRRSDPSPNSDKRLNDNSNTNPRDKGSGEPLPKVARTGQQSSSQTTRTVSRPNETGDRNKNGPSTHKSAPEPEPAPMEKTTDIEKLKGFLEKTYDCTLILTDDVPRMRFSGGRMRIPRDQFPTSLEDLESKMKVLVHQAFDKQVNKVKFSVNAYNVCESSGPAYHDHYVDATVAVIQREAVSAVLSHFHDESESTSSSDSGLWDSSDGDFEVNVYQYETYNFLPRLISNSSDGVNVSPSMLLLLLSNEKADCMVSSLLHAGGSRFLACKRLDEMLLSEMTTLQGLEVLMADAKFSDCLARVLSSETEKAVKHSLGNYFQEQCALTELLTVSTIPGSASGRQKYMPPPSALDPFRSLRSFPDLSQDDINTAQMMIQKGSKQIQQLAYSAMRRVVINKGTREVGLSWLATLLSLNELRTSSVLQDNMEAQPVCSDGFMVNVCTMLLEFFLPISQSLEKLEKVDLGYSVSPACRLTYGFERCLAGGQIETRKGEASKLGALPAALQGQHSFITECFHLTQRALSITIVPAIKHYNNMHSHYGSQLEQVKDVDKAKAKEVNNQHLLVTVSWETCLLESDLVYGVTMFYISQARLLLRTVDTLAEKHKKTEEAEKAQRKALSVIPEFCIKDMAQWFTFLANSVLRVKPHATKGITLTAFVDCCVMLLERPDLMPGPVPASMIVSALLAFMKDSDKSHKLGFRSSWGSGVMSDLAAMVHTCPSAQTKLGPALLRTYVSVDVVEGLDVDKDTFDKFNTRVQIGQLVEKLWSRTDCRGSIISHCGTEMFQNFLDSILDTLLYMLHDSLSRLANVKKIETLKANEAEWNALSRRQQAEKDMFLRSEEKVGSGFMRQAKKTLKFLNLISQSEKVAHCFTRQPLAARAASTINGFLDSLCGAKAKNLNVKDKAKYEFNPVELLLDIMNVILRITLEDVSRTDGYLVSMVKDPDFELANLEKAESVIVGKGFVSEDTTQKVTQLMEQVRMLAAEHCPAMPCLGDDEGNWRDAFVDLEIDEQSLEKEYTSVMQDQRFNFSRILESHCFQSNVQGAFDPRSPKVKVIMKEMKQLTSSLPVNAGASIFVRQDKDRMDVMRAVVTGPTDTPYSLGCFCFDVYFPAAYPNVPPLVKIITTGNGTVRFNPNLYADGKVCLSLLGTWHAGDASEKWNPGKSSLYQVLVSIQSMILTPDPVFNEPGYERIKDTEEGEVQSRQYNWKIHLQTLRHAVLGQLRNPPPGFERVIRQHFALQREAIFKQCAEWVKECEDPDLLKRLRKVTDAIFEEFMTLDVDFNEVEMDSEGEEEEEDDD